MGRLQLPTATTNKKNDMETIQEEITMNVKDIRYFRINKVNCIQRITLGTIEDLEREYQNTSLKQMFYSKHCPCVWMKTNKTSKNTQHAVVYLLNGTYNEWMEKNDIKAEYNYRKAIEVVYEDGKAIKAFMLYNKNHDRGYYEPIEDMNNIPIRIDLLTR